MMTPTAVNILLVYASKFWRSFDLLLPIIAPIFPICLHQLMLSPDFCYPIDTKINSHLSKADGPPILAPTGTGIVTGVRLLK